MRKNRSSPMGVGKGHQRASPVLRYSTDGGGVENAVAAVVVTVALDIVNMSKYGRTRECLRESDKNATEKATGKCQKLEEELGGVGGRDGR